jgi:hypothetical protein
MKKITFYIALFLTVLSVNWNNAQEQIAAWTFDALAANPNTPTVLAANLGSGTIYADGSNGSSTWTSSASNPQITAFGGNVLNDPRVPAVTTNNMALTLANSSANDYSIVLKFSTLGLYNPIITFATRGTGTGFNTHLWEWSTDGTTFTSFGSNTAVTTTSFVLKTIDLTAIDDVDNVADVYVRLTVSGASSASGNNRLENIVINADHCATNTTWTAGAWTNGTPDALKRAIIEENYSGPGFEACELIVNNGAVNMAIGETLDISYNVNVASTGSITLNDNAYLRQINNATNVGTGLTTVNKNSEPIKRLDYTGWSSPVSGQNLLAFSPATVTTRFYTYDPTNDGSTTDAWDWADPANNTFTPGRGYLVRAPNNWSSTTASAYPGVFTGTLNNGDVTFAIAEAGINMVGNPYASPINGDDFINAHNGTLGTTTLYFWTHTIPSNTTTGTYPTNNYASYTTAGGTAAAAGGATPDGIVNVGQGFLLDTPTAGDVVFTNAMRETSGAGQFFRTANVERHRMWFNLTSPDALHNQMLIAYMDGADNGIDNADGKMLGNSSSAIYNTLNNEMYVIQGRALPFNNADEVAMGFTATTAGNYTIDLGQTDGIFADNQEVYLRDNLLNVVHDIKSSPYTFASTEGVFLNRFDVIYTNSTLTVETPEFTENSVVLYASNGMLHVNSGAVQMQSIKVYDVQGRLITTKANINNTQTALEGFSAKQQVLLVEITSVEGVKVMKKYIF